VGVVLVALWVSGALAGAQGATGDLRGSVREQAGAPLAGVTVVVTHRASGVRRTVASGADGLFTISALPAGVYDIVATLQGFAEQRQEGVGIESGEMFVSRMEMRKAPLAETISLTGTAFDLEPMRTTPSSTMGEREIVLLPNPSRDPLDLLRLTPFLTRDSTGRWSALGLPGSSVGLLVDGGDNRSPVSGRPVALRLPQRGGYQFNAFTIQELHVTSGAPPAEFGHAASAFAGLLTRSGSSLFTGQLFERYRDGALTASTPADRTLGRQHAPVHANQFGATFGGPIVASRSVFFAAYDGLRERTDNPVVLALPDISNAAAGAGAARLQAASAPWPVTRIQDVALLRLDNRLGNSQRLSVRYNHHNLRGDGLEQQGTRISRDATGSSRLESRSLAVSLGTTAGGRFFNDLQLFHLRDRDSGTTYGTAPQADVRDAGALLLRVGGDAVNPHETKLQRWQAVNTLSWEGGRHAMKAGIDVSMNDVSHQFGTNAAGSYVFDSLATFATGALQLPGESYTQTFVADGGSQVMTTPDSHEYAAFVQDTWRLSDTVTLNAGVRYDVQAFDSGPSLSSAIAAIGPGLATIPRTDTNNVAPRVGFAWTPSSRYLVRAAYGITYGHTPLLLAASTQAYGSGALQTITVTSSDPTPAYPGVLPSLPAGAAGLPLAVAFARDFDQPQVQQASAGFEWEWMPRTSVSVTYQHATGRSLPQAVERNVGDAVSATFVDAGSGTPWTTSLFTPGPFVSNSRVIVLESTGRSTYDGVTIELHRGLSQGSHYRLAYTLGKATDTGPVTTLDPETADDRLVTTGGTSLVRAAALNDRRHRFVADVIYFTDGMAERQSGVIRAILNDWRLAAVYSLQTGLPYTAYVASDLNGDGNRFNDIAPGTTRSQFRRSKEGRLDARLARDIAIKRVTITPSVDLFNVFNAAHDRSIDDLLYTVSGSTLFRNLRFQQTFDPTDARAAQLGLTVTF
jgi:outer membrane receptor protein involved in Fe transport